MVADLIGQPLEVVGQVGEVVAVGDDLDALVEHVVAQLLELAHVLAAHQHEVLQVRLVLHRLQEESLERGVVHRPPAAQEHKRLGLVQLLDLSLKVGGGLMVEREKDKIGVRKRERKLE